MVHKSLKLYKGQLDLLLTVIQNTKVLQVYMLQQLDLSQKKPAKIDGDVQNNSCTCLYPARMSCYYNSC